MHQSVCFWNGTCCACSRILYDKDVIGSGVDLDKLQSGAVTACLYECLNSKFPHIGRVMWYRQATRNTTCSDHDCGTEISAVPYLSRGLWLFVSLHLPSPWNPHRLCKSREVSETASASWLSCHVNLSCSARRRAPQTSHARTAPRGALMCTVLATGRPRRPPMCRRYRAQREERTKRWLADRRSSGLMRLAYRGSAQWYMSLYHNSSSPLLSPSCRRTINNQTDRREDRRNRARTSMCGDYQEWYSGEKGHLGTHLIYAIGRAPLKALSLR